MNMRRQRLGQYTPSDPDAQKPENPNTLAAPGNVTEQPPVIVAPVNPLALHDPKLDKNVVRAGTYPFSINNERAQTIIPENLRRRSLIIQNFEASGGAGLWINFSGDANVNRGFLLAPQNGIIIDIDCPCNAVSVFFDSATHCNGVIVESAYIK